MRTVKNISSAIPRGRFRPCLLAVVLAHAVCAAAAPAQVTVQQGETLWSIAARELGSGQRWRELAARNGLAEPYRIVTSQVLLLPGADTPSPAPFRAETPARAATSPQPADRAIPPAVFAPAVAPSPSDASAADTTAAAWDLTYRVEPDTVGDAITLEDALATADRRNIALLSGRLDPRTARSNLEIARAAYDPTLSLSGEEAWRRTASSNPASSSFTDATTTTYSADIAQKLPIGTRATVSASEVRSASTSSLGAAPSHATDLSLNVTQPILKGFGLGADYAAVTSAEEAYAASRSRAGRLGATTASDIEAAYWTLAQSEEEERIAAASLRLSESLLRRNEEMLARGLIAAIEVLTARSGVASRRETLAAARIAHGNAAEALLFLVHGTDATGRSTPLRTSTSPPEPDAPEDAASLEARALARREDVAAARRDLEAAQIRLRSAENGLLPDLALTGSVGTGGTAGSFTRSLSDLGSNEEPSWSVGAVFTLPLGKREDRARHDAVAAALAKSELALTQAENAVREEVRDARRTVDIGRERLRLAQESRRLAEEQLVAEEKRLALGLGDTFRVLQTEQNVDAAYLAEARSRYSLATAAARLRSAVAGPQGQGAAR